MRKVIRQTMLVYAKVSLSSDNLKMMKETLKTMPYSDLMTYSAFLLGT